LEGILQVFAARLNNKNISLHKDIDPSSRVLGKAGELRQVFANLLSNSIDAVPSNGTIRIRIASATSRGRRGIRITFADDGPGIPYANRGKIFDPFFSTKGAVGTGLGLWVVKDLVSKHEGSVRVRSHNGSGPSWTVFSVFLPSEAEPRQTPQGEAKIAV
jgi:signal transduction histidine kinase